jgi:hypothetical protein
MKPTNDADYFEAIGYGGDHILFNLCNTITPAAVQNCKDEDSFGYLVTSKKVCSPLTARSSESSTVKFSEVDDGIQLEF